jgi:hypothetical protein
MLQVTWWLRVVAGVVKLLLQQPQLLAVAVQADY